MGLLVHLCYPTAFYRAEEGNWYVKLFLRSPDAAATCEPSCLVERGNVGVCRPSKAKKLLFSSSVMPAVVLSWQSIFSKLDISGKQGLRDQSSLHRKAGSSISAAASVVVLDLFLYCHGLRW